jgi:hypothetical protein
MIFYLLYTRLSISFVSKVKKMDKVDELDADYSEIYQLEFHMDPDNSASKSHSFLSSRMNIRGVNQVDDGLP